MLFWINPHTLIIYLNINILRPSIFQNIVNQVKVGDIIDNQFFEPLWGGVMLKPFTLWVKGLMNEKIIFIKLVHLV